MTLANEMVPLEMENFGEAGRACSAEMETISWELQRNIRRQILEGSETPLSALDRTYSSVKTMIEHHDAFLAAHEAAYSEEERAAWIDEISAAVAVFWGQLEALAVVGSWSICAQRDVDARRANGETQ